MSYCVGAVVFEVASRTLGVRSVWMFEVVEAGQ